MSRGTNILLAIILSFLLVGPIIFIAFVVRLTSKGPVLYWSERVGKNNINFQMPKFKTMKMDAPDVATHLLKNPSQYVTPIGKILRKTSLDELPQLWSVLRGNLALVGPRPALFNQDDLIAMRTEKGVHKLTPGITGWAQIQGRDELPIPEKVKMDVYYCNNRSILFDLKILWLTFFAVFRWKGVSH